MYKNGLQKGFTLVEGLLVILVVAVIGFGGYYVWQNQNDKDTKENSLTSKAAENSQDKSKTQTNETTSRLSDKEQIIKKVAATCTNEVDQKSTEAALLDGSKGEVRIEGAFAFVSAGCDSSGAFTSRLHKENDAWVVISSGQQAPACADFDGTGVPNSIVSECYDESTGDMRAPRS